MSDASDDEFTNKKNYLSKDEHIYGVFSEAYERPSFGRGQQKKSNTNKLNVGFISFKAGQKIETYSDKVEVTHLHPQKKKKVTFSDKNIYNQINNDPQPQPEGQQLFTLDALMNTLKNNQQKMQAQIMEQQQEIQIGFTNKTKSILKLKKYQQIKLDPSDYELPTAFGKRNKVIQNNKPIAQIQKQKQFSQKYGIGFKILSKIGFNATKGLGKNQDGRLQPVESVNKKALTAEDDEQPLIAQDQQKELQEQTQTQDKSMLELFQYFSQDPSVNSILQKLKTEYQTLEVKIQQQKQTINRMNGEIEIAQSQSLQYQSQYQQQIGKLKQLQQLKQNIDVHPHLALKFNIDLLIVKQSIQKMKVSKPEDLFQAKSIFRQIKSTCRKLQQIYLQKQRQIIKQFTSSGLKNMTNVNYYQKAQDTISISPEDINRIKMFQKMMFQSVVFPQFIKLLQKLTLTDDKNVSLCIQVFEGLSKIDKQIMEKYLDSHIYPLINDYLKNFVLKDILPHLIVFPWLTVITITKLDLQGFLFNLLSIQWSLEDMVMFNLINPWKKYLGDKNWSFFTNFGVAPRLLNLLFRFQISASQQNSKNLQKLKALIRYSEMLSVDQVQAILQDTILPAIKDTYLTLKQKQVDEKVKAWLSNWKNTLSKLKSSSNFLQFFTELSIL